MNQFGRSGESSSHPVAFIGDVVASRSVSDRQTLQEKLDRLVSEAGAGDPTGSPIALTAGDEVQGINVAGPEHILPTLVLLTEALLPTRIVFGVGKGELDADLGGHVAHMDGPCFHRARAAAAEARKRGRWVVASGFGSPEDEILNALFELMHSHRGRWTPTQTAYAREARTRELRKDVAAHFGVNPSVVTESLQSAAFDAIRRGEDSVARILAGTGTDFEGLRP